MPRTNRVLLTIPIVSLASATFVFGWSPAAAAPAPGQFSHPDMAIGHPGAASATGKLTATIDPATVEATPTRGGNTCRLTDSTTLKLTGSVAGTVEGTTIADVKAPCDLATTTPPGTYPATFTLTGTFRGTVAKYRARSDAVYTGTVSTGGDVSAVLTLRGRASAVLKVRAQVGGAGTYKGVTVIRSKS